MFKALAQSSVSRNRTPTLLAAEVAGQQWGVIGWHQLLGCGLTKSMAHRWRRAGTLHVLYPEVFTLGHRSLPVEGRMVGALLHAGDSAVLSHATAAWWWGLIADEPTTIEVSTHSWARSCPGVAVHQRRSRIGRTRHRRFPITSVAQTLLDYAAGADLLTLRRAVAQADYLRLLDLHAINAALGQGRPGSAQLRRAIKRHEPRLALTRSRLELEFVPLCESAGIPLPEINAKVAGWPVDALWREERLIVELDGYDNHSTRTQMERDRQKELELRAAGFLVIRYTWPQVTERPELVVADLLARLAERRHVLSSTGPSAVAGSR